jgi:transcriptional regulator with XRE-family HTH domain
MADEYGLTSRGRQLAAALRRLREDAGLTLENAAKMTGESRTKLTRVELGEVLPTVEYVQRILGAYGGTDQALRFAIKDLAERARERGWFSAFGDVFNGPYAELENDASTIMTWQTELVPGLFQIADYARVLIQESVHDPVEVERRLQARLTRQAILFRDPAPVIRAILAEEVLRRPVGGPDVMREQLTTLTKSAQMPSVSLRIVPAQIGHHPAIGQGSMVIFEFESKAATTTAYFETVAGGHYIEEVQQVNRCTDTFNKIASTALPEEESAQLIEHLSKEF